MKKLNTTLRRVKQTKGNCHLTHGGDAYEKQELNRRRRELDKALCDEGEDELWDADSNCNHNIVEDDSGGIKCTKCEGWFCF